LLKRIDEIEKTIISVRMPSSFANEVYVLRAHINFVRDRLGQGKATTSVRAGERESDRTQS